MVLKNLDVVDAQIIASLVLSSPNHRRALFGATTLRPIDFLQQLRNRRAVRGFLAAMREQYIAAAIKQKIAAGLIVVISAVALKTLPFAQ